MSAKMVINQRKQRYWTFAYPSSKEILEKAAKLVIGPTFRQSGFFAAGLTRTPQRDVNLFSCSHTGSHLLYFLLHLLLVGFKSSLQRPLPGLVTNKRKQLGYKIQRLIFLM